MIEPFSFSYSVRMHSVVVFFLTFVYAVCSFKNVPDYRNLKNGCYIIPSVSTSSSQTVVWSSTNEQESYTLNHYGKQPPKPKKAAAPRKPKKKPVAMVDPEKEKIKVQEDEEDMGLLKIARMGLNRDISEYLTKLEYERSSSIQNDDTSSSNVDYEIVTEEENKRRLEEELLRNLKIAEEESKALKSIELENMAKATVAADVKGAQMAAALWEKTTDPLDKFLSRVIAFSDSNQEFDDDDKMMNLIAIPDGPAVKKGRPKKKDLSTDAEPAIRKPRSRKVIDIPGITDDDDDDLDEAIVADDDY